MPTEYEQAVTEYVEADTKYKDLERRVLDGSLVVELLTSDQDPNGIKQSWQSAMNHLQTLLEDRNAKLNNAKNKMRQAVQLTETQWRGPEGKATMVRAGPLEASSTTHRTFDVPTLFDQCKKKGLLERLLGLTKITKDGKEVKLIEQEWRVEYQDLYKWLRENQLDDVLNIAYEEKEKTPAVKGAKEVAFLGEVKEK